MMNWTDLLQHYGYFAVFIGTFFEGETVLTLGAYAVHQHILHFWPLILTAVLGSFLGDQLYYQIGHRYGTDFINKRPKLAEKFEQASIFIQHYPTLTILLMRFAWGLRTVLPVSFGIKKYPVIRYMFVNLIACFIWAFVIISIGIQVSLWLHKFWKMILPFHSHLTIIIAVISCIILIRFAYSLYMKYQTKQKTL